MTVVGTSNVNGPRRRKPARQSLLFFQSVLLRWWSAQSEKKRPMMMIPGLDRESAVLPNPFWVSSFGLIVYPTMKQRQQQQRQFQQQPKQQQQDSAILPWSASCLRCGCYVCDQSEHLLVVPNKPLLHPKRQEPQALPRACCDPFIIIITTSNNNQQVRTKARKGLPMTLIGTTRMAIPTRVVRFQCRCHDLLALVRTHCDGLTPTK